jgi:Nif-specific regulatory protein
VIGHVYATGMPAVVPDVAQAPEFIDRTGAFRPEAGQCWPSWWCR